MAKRKVKTRNTIEAAQASKHKEPKMTHAAYQITFWLIILGLIVQLVVAFMVYPSLPQETPATWIGSSDVESMVPSWVIFLAFPGAELILLILAIFSHRDAANRRVMGSEKAISLILLAVLFTLLQATAFRLIPG